MEEKISKYNLLCKNLKKPTKNIALDIQIDPEEIKKYLDSQKSFEKDIKSYLIEEETFIYWEIPFKNEKGKSIRYNKDIQIFRGNYDKLYFIIEEINDEFKNNFSMNIKEIEKSGIKAEENNKSEEVKDYMSFDEAKKNKVKIYRLDKNDNTFIETIKNQELKNINYQKFTFKGKKSEEFSKDINKLKNHLSLMKYAVSSIKDGNFVNINLTELKKEYEKMFKNINYYFDISNNKENSNIDFSVIKRIKSDFEKKLYLIFQDFKFLDEKFDNIRNITEGFSPNSLKSSFL